MSCWWRLNYFIWGLHYAFKYIKTGIGKNSKTFRRLTVGITELACDGRQRTLLMAFFSQKGTIHIMYFFNPQNTIKSSMVDDFKDGWVLQAISRVS